MGELDIIRDALILYFRKSVLGYFCNGLGTEGKNFHKFK